MAHNEPKAPALQFYPRDFLADTGHLNNEELGAYVRLLFTAWDPPAGADGVKPPVGHLPNERNLMLSIARCAELSVRVISLLRTSKDGATVYSHRMVEERKKQVAYSKSRSLNGKKGGRPRKHVDSSDESTWKAQESSASASASASAQEQQQKPAGDARPIAARRKREPLPELPGVGCSRAEALAAIARTSAGRFVHSPPDAGGVFKLDPYRRRPDAVQLFERVGAWLAAGGDAWRGQLDGRAVGPNLDAWVALAEAWDGGPIAREKARGGTAGVGDYSKNNGGEM